MRQPCSPGVGYPWSIQGADAVGVKGAAAAADCIHGELCTACKEQSILHRAEPQPSPCCLGGRRAAGCEEDPASKMFMVSLLLYAENIFVSYSGLYF